MGAATRVLTPEKAESIGGLEEETRRSCKAETDPSMKKRTVVRCLATLGVMAIVSCAQAQSHGGLGSATPGRVGAVVSRGGVVGRGVVRLHRGCRSSAGFIGAYYDPYYDSETDTVEAPPARLIVERAAEPGPTASAPKPAESLVLELQGDRWVRITGFGQSQTIVPSSEAAMERTVNTPSALPAAFSRRAQTAEPAAKLPPAVLVFRDGHTEEIGKYMIRGATLYTSADYWSSGSWTRKVPIAELDVPATLKQNQERGAKFSLPSGPSEVMIRP